MDPTNIEIHTDGACLNNPGPGGYAAIIIPPYEKEITIAGLSQETTNNRMELMAVIAALNYINQNREWDGIPAVIHSDSQYVISPITQGWLENWDKNGWRTANKQSVKNQDLWLLLMDKIGERRTTWKWVKGHSGDLKNERCDQLAREQAELASKGRNLKVGPTVYDPATKPTPNSVPTVYRPIDKPDPTSAQPGSLPATDPWDLIKTALEESQSFDEFRQKVLERETRGMLTEIVDVGHPAYD